MSDERKHPGFSADETRTLASVLDEIIPPSADGRLPGAGDLGLAGYITQAIRQTPEIRPMIAQGLADLDELARGRKAPSFAALPQEDKRQLLSEQGFVLPLALHASGGYYQHPRVVTALGLEARPPHPKGYEMEPTDLAILDAVRRHSKHYREC
jgi:hypothetical protein